MAGFFSSWSRAKRDEETDAEASMTRHVLEWAAQKVWGLADVAEWPTIEVPDTIKETWDGFKDVLGVDGMSRDETDGTGSR